MVTASAYTNGDDVFLAWSMPKTADCWAFALSRELTNPSGETSSASRGLSARSHTWPEAGSGSF